MDSADLAQKIAFQQNNNPALKEIKSAKFLHFLPKTESHLTPLLTGLKTDSERIKVWQNAVYDSLGNKIKKVSDWLSRIVKDAKVKRDAQIFDLWLACHTQEQIGEAVGLNRTVVGDICNTFVETVLENQNHKTAANHITDFTIPIYNVWKQQTKTRISCGRGYQTDLWKHYLV
ncbi:hypothetical protein [Methylobacter psychrophilus]|uniref:hypothetical protein n=1 Tax=Methylobacter psychrophilus TaxID=96941 RepID=UPI0021D4A457|nr:hypothetical protein [Methylobacter psychrophilus]